MTHRLNTETFSQKIEHSGSAFFLPLTSLFSFVTFHLKSVTISPSKATVHILFVICTRTGLYFRPFLYILKPNLLHLRIFFEDNMLLLLKLKLLFRAIGFHSKLKGYHRPLNSRSNAGNKI